MMDTGELTAGECLAARRLLNWAQMTLAKAAGVEVRAVIDFERERAGTTNVGALIRQALERAGLEFAEGEPCFKSRNEDFVRAPDDWRLHPNEIEGFIYLSNIHPTDSK